MFSTATLCEKNTIKVFLNTIICLFNFTLLECLSKPISDSTTQERVETESIKNVAYSSSTFGLYDISTFDLYVDKQKIHIIVGGRESNNDEHTALRYTYSEDGGHTWLTPIIIDKQFPRTIAKRGNDVQIAAIGKHIVALWQAQSDLPSMGPIVSIFSHDHGTTWQRGVNPAVDNSGSQTHIDLIADDNGRFHVTWLEDPNENGYQSLRYANSNQSGKHWSSPITLDDSTCSCCWNMFAISPYGDLNILYRNMDPRDMSLIRSSDARQRWENIGTVGQFNWQFSGCPHTGGSLSYTPKDTPHLHSLVWTGLEEKAGLYHLHTSNNGQSWSDPRAIGNTAIHGDITAFNSKTIFAIWNELEAEGLSIFYTKSLDGAVTWQTPKRLTDANFAATHPKLATTRNGVLAMWTESPEKTPARLAWMILR